MKALVTGFDAFGGDAVNPSSLAVGEAPEEADRRHRRAHRPAADLLRASRPRCCVTAIEKARPDIVLCVGQAGGRSELCLERVAINVQDARIRDNDGKQPIDKPVVKDGPAAHFTTLPIKACVAEMRKAGLPAAVSNTAGTFVCNHIFYALMDIAAGHPIPMRGGFLHIPYVPEQAARLGGAPSMALGRHRARHRDHPQRQRGPDGDIHTAEGRIS